MRVANGEDGSRGTIMLVSNNMIAIKWDGNYTTEYFITPEYPSELDKVFCLDIC